MELTFRSEDWRFKSDNSKASKLIWQTLNITKAIKWEKKKGRIYTRITQHLPSMREPERIKFNEGKKKINKKIATTHPTVIRSPVKSAIILFSDAFSSKSIKMQTVSYLNTIAFRFFRASSERCFFPL